VLWPALLLVLSPLLEGCGVEYVRGAPSPDFYDYPIKKVAVLPFLPQSIPAEDRIPVARQVAEGSMDLLTKIFIEQLGLTGRYQIVAPEQIDAALKTTPPDKSGTMTTGLAQAIGKTVKADAVIIGRVQRFIERVGGEVGIERPASVGFVVTMIGVGDGRTLWSGEYYETQKTLSEDVNTLPLFIKRGGKWLTARELAEYGMKEMIKTLPKKKE
jgi:hypothetical protein